MDVRKAKRPQSATSSKGEPPLKKKKSSKKKKQSTSQSETETKHHSSLETTATKDGQMMAQMLSTFSKMEQSRFEAFKRAALPQDIVQEFLAACLSHRFGLTEPRPLSDLVAPGQTDQIGMVVSVLAKVYAQRLVSTARSLAGGDETPLTPHDVRRAYEQRQRQGLDPGFFLQAAEGTQQGNGTTLPDSQDYDQRRLAALAAQEEYDQHHSQEEEKDTDDDQMEIDSPEKEKEQKASTTA